MVWDIIGDAMPLPDNFRACKPCSGQVTGQLLRCHYSRGPLSFGGQNRPVIQSERGPKEDPAGPESGICICKVMSKLLFIGNDMDDGGGIDRVELLRSERECFRDNKEILHLLPVTVQVKAEVDTLPVDIERGDPLPGKTVTDQLPDIVPRATAVIEKPAGPAEYMGIEEVAVDPWHPDDHENVGIAHSLFPSISQQGCGHTRQDT